MSFIKGIELCRRFHIEIVEPVMTDSYPFLSYSSALIGPGSEVLGYDTEMSTDHDWVPRVYLFLNQPDIGYSELIQSTLQERAPERFYGFPVDIGRSVITTVPRFIESYLAVSKIEELEPVDWLTFPSQSLLEITRGKFIGTITVNFPHYANDSHITLTIFGYTLWHPVGSESVKKNI